MKLYNGIDMPSIGLGPGGVTYKRMTWERPLKSYELHRRIARKFCIEVVDRAARICAEYRYVKAVASGIQSGYRLIDFSAAYGNAGLIKNAIKKSGFSREELFLTARISNRAQFSGLNAVRAQIQRHLDLYQTDYVDLLMFHWPVTDYYESTWKVICDAYNKGIARSIGVANCHPRHVERLLKCGLKPMVNQFEVHPLFTQKELIKYNQDLGIVVESYTPIARNDDRLMRLPRLRSIAEAHNKTPVQVVLRWHVQHGLVPVVRSLNAVRQAQNIDIFDFELSSEEMRIIDAFNINSRLRYDPDNCDFSVL